MILSTCNRFASKEIKEDYLPSYTKIDFHVKGNTQFVNVNSALSALP